MPGFRESFKKGIGEFNDTVFNETIHMNDKESLLFDKVTGDDMEQFGKKFGSSLRRILNQLHPLQMIQAQSFIPVCLIRNIEKQQLLCNRKMTNKMNSLFQIIIAPLPMFSKLMCLIKSKNETRNRQW